MSNWKAALLFVDSSFVHSWTETNFLLPMFIGDVAQVKARLTFVSTHSAEVYVTVFAESIGFAKRTTNTATLWYCCVLLDAAGDKLSTTKPLVLRCVY